MKKEFMEQIGNELVGEIKVNEPMSRHTTFRIGGPAELYAVPGVEGLKLLLAQAGQLDIPVTIIGNGSNLLVGDGGIPGLVIEIGKAMEGIVQEGNRIRVGAGTILSKAARAAADAGLSGLEFAAGIPGSLGGAVVMNAGAYGGEMKDVVAETTVLTPDGQLKVLSAEELEFSYRHSSIPGRNYIVVEVLLELTPGDSGEIQGRMEELRKRRISKQPLEFPSAGSTFKRPEGFFAGKLIDDAGLRGYRVGDAQVSEKHCGFVVNRGNATAAEVRQLMEDVQQRIWEEFQVRLEPEVRQIGIFT